MYGWGGCRVKSDWKYLQKCFVCTAYTGKINLSGGSEKENKNSEITYKQIKKLKTAMPLGAAN